MTEFIVGRLDMGTKDQGDSLGYKGTFRVQGDIQDYSDWK